MKWLRPLALALFLPQLLSATANVSGKLAAPDTTGVPSGSVARLDLRNCGGNYPVVSGASITTRQEYALAADGTWSGVLYRNDEISCNGSFTTFWTLTYFVRNVQAGPSRDYLCSQASCNFDSMTPITVYPPPTPPAQPLTGAESVVCSFPVAASTWSCTENMGTQQVVAEFFDLLSTQIFPDTAQATDINTFVGTFLQPQAGFVRVVNVGNWTPSVSVPNYLISNPTSDQSVAGDHALAVGGSLSAKRIEKRRVVDENTSGSTLDAKLTTQCNDLPSTGGEIDVQLGTTPQPWSTLQFSCGSATKSVYFHMNGTIVQPGSSSVNMWKVEPGNIIDGFTLDCSTQPTYSGTVFQNDTSVSYLEPSQTAIINYTALTNCKNVTTGKHLQLSSTSSATGIAYFFLYHWRAQGLSDGVLGLASGNGFTNDVRLIDVQIGSAQTCIHANATGGQIDGWQIPIGNGCEQAPGGVNALKWESDGSANSTIRYWKVFGNFWDYTTWGNLTAGPTIALDNDVEPRADGSCSGNCGATTSDTTWSTFNNIRFADSSVAENRASFGGFWRRVHSGHGTRWIAVDLNTAFEFYPTQDGGSNNVMELDNVGVGAIFQAKGVGGSGRLTMLGASGAISTPKIGNPAGSDLAVPTTGANLVSDTATQLLSNKSTAAGPLTGTVGSGTGTTAGTAIGAGTSQTLAITVSGALTTDVAQCSTNAAYPATWLTGITVLPPVVTANTVTLTLTNPSAASITPVAQPFRCTVTR